MVFSPLVELGVNSLQSRSGEKIILKILFGYRPHHNPELDRTASEVEALTRLDRCSTETNRVPVTPAKFLEKILRRSAVRGWNI